MTFAPSGSQGYFLDPTLIIPEDRTDLEYKVKDVYTQIADATNIREVALYPLLEIETGQQWFTPGNPQSYRDGWRKVVSIGSVAAGGTSGAIAHGITGITAFTHIYGTAVSGANYYALPYAEAAGTGNIEVQVTGTTVTVIGGATAPALTDVYIVLEYIKGVG